jgi:hypothetical protein
VPGANQISIRSVAERIRFIQRLFRPIRPKARGHVQDVPVRSLAVRGVGTVVSARDGETGDSHRDWRFRTRADWLMAQYFEVWVEDSSGSALLMAQASLHLFSIPGPSVPEKELIALHCEPGHLGGTRTDVFKRGPHVHVSADGNRLAHAHIPLNYCDLDRALASRDSLSDALMKAVEVLETEVIDSRKVAGR